MVGRLEAGLLITVEIARKNHEKYVNRCVLNAAKLLLRRALGHLGGVRTGRRRTQELWGNKRENIGVVCGCGSGGSEWERGERGSAGGGHFCAGVFREERGQPPVYRPVTTGFGHRFSPPGLAPPHDCRAPIVSARLLAAVAIGHSNRTHFLARARSGPSSPLRNSNPTPGDGADLT